MIRQLPWFERTFHFDFPIQMFPVIFSRLEGTLFRLSRILIAAKDAESSCTDGGWSVKQHLGHLTDLEELWWKRLNDFREKKPVLSPADLTNKKTYEGRHNEKTLDQLLKEFSLERQQVLETIYDFDVETLKITSIHPRLNQPMRLIDLLYFVAEHDDHHIAVISELLRRQSKK